jgi:arabinofuranan 3-O-arabinosyltransferase
MTTDTSRAPRWFWLIALLPPLWSSPGRIAADTKTYLSLDPSGLLAQAPSLWESDTGLGTVTHQTIGYLFPQGPWWWIADLLAIPDWITQRLWWSLLVATALFGAHRLARHLEHRSPTVTALAYGFSPYLFAYISRISAILVPWAVLPWMIIVLRRGASDEHRWRYPARFALLVLVAGTVNATSIGFVVAGAAIWLIAETGSLRTSLPVLWRSAALSLGVSLWWVIALVMQGSNGIEILRFTETYETIMRTALPSELLRGFGYWFSYGGDWLDPWVGATYGVIAQPWYLALGFALSLGGVIGLTLVSGVARRPAAVAVIAGLAFAVGEAWTGGVSPWGVFFGAAVDAGPGMVLRSTQRAVPLLALGLAFGLGALAVTPPRIGRFARTPIILGALALQALPWWTGGIATEAITRGEIPGYWNDVVALIGDDVDHRVWETPGSDFASYRWGGTVDPVLVGLTDRPVVARELIPLGTDGAADLVSEIERRVAENTLSSSAITPLARLMGVDTVVARNDLEFERYALARPDDVTERLDAAGLDRVLTGPDTEPDTALIDEQSYGGVPGIGVVPAVAVWEVDEPVPVLSGRSGEPIIVHGSAATIVALAAEGLIDGREVLIDGDSAESVDDGAWTVLGDSNRLEDRRWYSIGAILGATRAVGETSDDPSLQSLDVIDDPARATVSELDGGFEYVTATSYGSPAVLSAEDRPEHAVDNDPFTAWRGAALESTDGLAWEGALSTMSSPAWVDLVQPLVGERDRWITRARIITNGPSGEWSSDVELTETSRALPGQRVLLSGRPIESIRIEVLADSVGPLPGYGNSPGVGFAEITLDGVEASTEWIVLPDDPRAPSLTSDDPGRTTIVLDRRRIDPATANRFDPEPRLARSVDLAVAGRFSISGAWSQAAHAPDPVILDSSPALVGVRELVWVSEFDAVDPFVVVDLDRSMGDRLDIVVATGSLYSSIGEVTVTDEAMNEVRATPDADGLVSFVLDSLNGERVRVAFGEVSPQFTVDRFSDRFRALPVGIVSMSPVVSDSGVAFDECRDDLLEIDGTPISMRLHDGGTFSGCDATDLGPGRHLVRSAAGHVTGVDIDRLVLDTGSGRLMTDVEPMTMNRSDTSVRATLDVAADRLVFAESFSPGWSASIDGVDLGSPTLVNGYAMGWDLPDGVTGDVVITWEPQRSVDLALVVALVIVLITVGLASRRGAVGVLATSEPSGRRGFISMALLVVAFGAIAVLAPLLAPCTRRGRRWVLAVPFAAMWLWTSVRQVRWDMPVDLWWPSSMAWAQWIVVGVVAACCWVALTDE